MITQYGGIAGIAGIFIIIIISSVIFKQLIGFKKNSAGLPINLNDLRLKFHYLRPYTASNASFMYILLGIQLTKVSRNDAKQKVAFIRNYALKKFDIDGHLYVKNYLQSMKTPTNSDQIAHYFNKKLKVEAQKIGLIHYLCGIALNDGLIDKAERNYIDNFCLKLKLKPQVVNAIIDQYYTKKQEDDKRQKDYRTNSRTTSSSTTRSSARIKYAKILEISETANWKEIKKNYRTLAKKWHPDFYAQKDAGSKYMAHEKFKEIQEAYEYFEELFRMNSVL